VIYERYEPFRMSAVDAEGEAAIYCEESGNPAGIPALWLHGGPGGSLGSGWYRTHFDPARYRLIGIDQRGTGKSRSAGSPTGEMDRQNTQQLINDIDGDPSSDEQRRHRHSSPCIRHERRRSRLT
jgi:pimeloyl-ACP methyl ester carboxylesterase